MNYTLGVKCTYLLISIFRNKRYLSERKFLFKIFVGGVNLKKNRDNRQSVKIFIGTILLKN